MPVFSQYTTQEPYIAPKNYVANIPDILPQPVPQLDISDFMEKNNNPSDFSQPPDFFKNTWTYAPGEGSIEDFNQYKNNPGGFQLGADNEDIAAKNQGTWNMIRHGLGRLVLTTGTKLGTGLGYLAGLAGIGNKSEDYGGGLSGWISGAADNGMAKWFQTAEDETIKKDWLPIYQQTQDKDHGFFRRFGDMDFWTSDLVDGTAFMASAFVPGMTIEKMGIGAKALNGLRVLNEAAQGADKTAEAATLGADAVKTTALSDEGLTGTSEAVTGQNPAVSKTPNIYSTPNATQVIPRVVSWIDNAKLARNINVGATSIINTASMAMYEAKSTKDNVYNDLVQKKDENGNYVYTPEQARNVAANAARNTFLMNSAALTLSSLWEANLIFKKAPLSGAEHAIEDISTKSLFDDAELGKKTFGENAFNSIKNAAKGALTMGLYQSNIQMAIQRLNSNDENFDLSFGGELAGLAKQYLKQTTDLLSGDDKDLAMGIGVGALTGAVAGAVFGENENKNTRKSVDDLNKSMNMFRSLGSIYEQNEDGSLKVDNDKNPVLDKTKIKSFLASVNKVLNLNDVANSLSGKGEKVLSQIYQDEVFSRFVKAHLDAGLGDLVYQKLNDLSKINKGDLAVLGYDPNSLNGDTQNILDAYKAKAKQLQKIYDNINQNFVPGFKTNNKAGREKFADMTDKMYHLSARSQSLMDRVFESGQRMSEVKTNSAAFDVPFTSASDNIVDQHNVLLEDLNATKRRSTQVVSEQYHIDNLTDQVNYEKNGITVQAPSKIERIRKNNPSMTVSLPERVQENFDQELETKQQALDKFTEDNKETLENLKKDANGRYLYEIDDKNKLPSSKEIAKEQMIQSELKNAHNATVNVLSRLNDPTYGEKYYDDVFKPALARNAVESGAYNEAEEIGPNPDLTPKKDKRTFQHDFTENEINNIYNDVVDTGKVVLTDDYNQSDVAEYLAEKIANGEELTDNEKIIRQILSKDVEEKLNERRGITQGEDILDKIHDLEQEKESLEAKTDRTIEDEERLTQVENQLDAANDQLDDKIEDMHNEDLVGESKNIQVGSKPLFKQVLDKISQNKKGVVKFDTHYEINGERYRKVSEVIKNVIPDSVRAKIQNAINAGYTIDDIVKNYFSQQGITDDYKSAVAPRISEDAFNNVIKNLDNIKKSLTAKGIEIVGSNVVVYDPEQKIAGEIDLLGVDKHGNFKIYEISARQDHVYRGYTLIGRDGISIRDLDQRELSAYRNLFSNQYGVVPDEIAVKFPFVVSYDKEDPSGFIKGTNVKKEIRFTPSNDVLIKRNVFEPIRVGSKFDHIDLLNIFATTFLSDDTLKGKLKFLLRNVKIDEIKNKIELHIKDAEPRFIDRYNEQQKLLNGEKSEFKPTKYKGFDNMYSLVGNKEISLVYDGQTVGYLSPAQTLAYKDETGKWQVLDENTDEQTYTDVTGNSKETFPEFKRISQGYKQMHGQLSDQHTKSGKKTLVIKNENLKGIAEVNVSPGELDKIPVGSSRPDLKDLTYSGVKIGNKHVPTVVNLDSADGIQVLMDKTNKSKAFVSKFRDVDKWANDHIDNIKAALSDNTGRRVGDYVGIIEIPNGDYRIISLRQKVNTDLSTTNDFVEDLGSKFTTAVSKDVFKNEGLSIIPKYNEETQIADLGLKSNKVAAVVYPTENIEEIEKLGIPATKFNANEKIDKINSFLNSVSIKNGFEASSLETLTNSEAFGSRPELKNYIENVLNKKITDDLNVLKDANSTYLNSLKNIKEISDKLVKKGLNSTEDILEDYNNSAWGNIEDYLENLKNCP